MSLRARPAIHLQVKRQMPPDPAAQLTDAHLPLRSDAAMQCHVYLLANRRQGALYLGVTSNLVQRVWQHREGVADGFTRRYGVKRLMWFEGTSSIEAAIAREKQIKNWKREWKIALIEKENPGWRDLWEEIL